MFRNADHYVRFRGCFDCELFQRDPVFMDQIVVAMIQNSKKLRAISSVLDFNAIAFLSPVRCTNFLVLSAERISSFISLVWFSIISIHCFNSSSMLSHILYSLVMFVVTRL